MTPPAASTAARRASGAASTGHRRTVRRAPAGRGARRVSGPARPTTRPTARSARPSATRLGFQGGSVALPSPARRPGGLAEGIARRAGTLSRSPLLGRLTAGRVWIGLIAILLIGLVYFQVALLKVNAQMGADVQRAAKLETQIAIASADINKLDTLDRIQQEAANLGMVLPTSGAVTFLGPDGENVGGDVAPVLTAADATTAALPTLPTAATEQATDPALATGTTTTTTTTTTDPAATAPTTVTPTTTATAPAPTATDPAATATATSAATTAPTATTDPAATTAAPVTTGGAAIPPAE